MENEEQDKPKQRGPGRPKGSLGRRHEDAKALVSKTNCDPLEFLLRVVKNRRVALDQRIKAAAAAAVFCHPKLSTTRVEGQLAHEHAVTQHLVLDLAKDPKMAELMERLSIEMSMRPKPESLLELIPEPELLLEATDEAEQATDDQEDDLLFYPEGTKLAAQFNPPKPLAD